MVESSSPVPAMSSKSEPIRLRRLTIENFRGIDRLELDLPEGDEDRAGALVIAGDNGCGKTSVLEAILLLLGRVDLLPADTASPRDLVRVGAPQFRIEGQFNRAGTSVTVEVETFHVERLLRVLNVVEGGPTSAAVANAQLNWALDAGFVMAPRPHDCAVEFFSVQRETTPVDASDARDVSRAVTREARLAELSLRLQNAAARKGHEALFARLNDFVRPFLGEAWTIDVVYESASMGSRRVAVVRDGELPVEAGGPVDTLDSLRERAARGEPTPRVIPLDRLSSGQRAVLAIAYPFLFGDRGLDLALIDEPEQHLQPSWQRAFLGALRRLSPQTQFIVATHSPQVLDSVARYERCALSSSDDWHSAPVPDAAE